MRGDARVGAGGVGFLGRGIDVAGASQQESPAGQLAKVQVPMVRVPQGLAPVRRAAMDLRDEHVVAHGLDAREIEGREERREPGVGREHDAAGAQLAAAGS